MSWRPVRPKIALTKEKKNSKRKEKEFKRWMRERNNGCTVSLYILTSSEFLPRKKYLTRAVMFSKIQLDTKC